MSAIHSTLPENAQGSDWSPDYIRTQIGSVLKRGEANAITAAAIAKLLGLRESGATNPMVRKACKELLVEGGVPIISCSRGFFLADSRAELHKYRDSLELRRKGLLRDIQAVDKIARQFTGKLF